ncbi:unnamed protein product [Rotaria sordida]|uniref:Uncharacterized protein n=1 Tax=Rotaria sordida TaxID=392033 RepID=A0A818R7R6_9BILA|nr:unnamed protein product [Rotaria sordida]CAF1017508.1 unnamed protein product [Rotaria sordida]CAF1130742.1 unnamed protein product [Rotaria sordida]CAF1140328.1 unnamed protein product [Rotaria sordida]CAF1418380.1 unnamed protein product [Rotaria sordida]
MKRNRSLNNDQTEFSLKRVHVQNEINLKDTKQEQSYLQINPIHLNLSDKRHIIEKVQLWLSNIRPIDR